MSGIRREHGTRPLRKAAPLELDPLARLLEPIDTATLAGRRDRALLLLGFAAALRRSSSSRSTSRTSSSTPRAGSRSRSASPRRDQEQAGAQVAVPYARARDRCAVRALQAWLEAAAIHRGPVFRQMRRGDKLTDRRLTDQSVALIVKRRAQAAGVPPSSSPGTRCAPATRPRPRPPASRSARSPTSPATRTSPSYAATSAPRPRSTTSAKCCKGRKEISFGKPG